MRTADINRSNAHRNIIVSVLAVFVQEPPRKSEKWWQQFNTLIAPKQLEFLASRHKLTFIDIDSLVDPGNIHEASNLTRTLSLLTASDGRRLSKIIKYEGFELWWIYYDDLMYKFCLPYTQYARLLKCLKKFPNIHLYKPPFPAFFRYFLESHECQYIISEKFKGGISAGILLQVALSIPSILYLKIIKPGLMVWTSDQFSPDGDYDFRMKFIYDEIQKKEIKFVEFIRSMEASPVIVRHAFRRRRPVVYSYAIVTAIRRFVGFLRMADKRELSNLQPCPDVDGEQRFWFMVATNYLHNVAGDIWAIRTLKFILKFIGIRSAIIPSGVSRNFIELLACKLSGIATVGIQHGASLRYHSLSDFMPEFNGERPLSLDRYGLWSDWWKEYYVKNSSIYKPEQLYVSGLMRPFKKNTGITVTQTMSENRPMKVLFVSEQLAAPVEVMPYLNALMKLKDISLYLKFRSYNDGFEDWLKQNHSDVLEQFSRSNILKGSMHEAITQCDITVGTMSAGVLEALLDLKPFVFFRTNKWGDYYELKDYNSSYKFFVENPQELVDAMLAIGEIPQDAIKELQNRFFGDPYKNGSQWVVEQVEGFPDGDISQSV